MTIKELNNIAFDVSKKVRAFRTFSILFNVAITNTHSIEERKNILPELDDISNVTFMLADQAEEAMSKLVSHLPFRVGDITQ